MMGKTMRVWATISSSTKEKLDDFTRRRGLQRSHVMEQALQFFMQSHQDVPEQGSTPSRLILGDRAFAALLGRLAEPLAPMEALCSLMRGERR